MHIAFGHQVGDPAGQHPGLAGARAGHDQHRAAGVHHRFSLRHVEAVQQHRIRDRDRG